MLGTEKYTKYKYGIRHRRLNFNYGANNVVLTGKIYYCSSLSLAPCFKIRVNSV